MAMQLLMIKACITWTQGYSETIYYILRAGGDTRSVLCIDGLLPLDPYSYQRCAHVYCISLCYGCLQS